MPPDIELALTDRGVACGLKGLTFEGLEQAEGAARFRARQRLRRGLPWMRDTDLRARWEPEPVTVTLCRRGGAVPPGSFLQATADGEAALVCVRARVARPAPARSPISFSGLGTFAFALAESGQGAGGRSGRAMPTSPARRLRASSGRPVRRPSPRFVPQSAASGGTGPLRRRAARSAPRRRARRR